MGKKTDLQATCSTIATISLVRSWSRSGLPMREALPSHVVMHCHRWNACTLLCAARTLDMKNLSGTIAFTPEDVLQDIDISDILQAGPECAPYPPDSAAVDMQCPLPFLEFATPEVPVHQQGAAKGPGFAALQSYISSCGICSSSSHAHLSLVACYISSNCYGHVQRL